MVELVDTQDLKSCSRKRSAGSIPALSTKNRYMAVSVFLFYNTAIIAPQRPSLHFHFAPKHIGLIIMVLRDQSKKLWDESLCIYIRESEKEKGGVSDASGSSPESFDLCIERFGGSISSPVVKEVKDRLVMRLH